MLPNEPRMLLDPKLPTHQLRTSKRPAQPNPRGPMPASFRGMFPKKQREGTKTTVFLWKKGHPMVSTTFCSQGLTHHTLKQAGVFGVGGATPICVVLNTMVIIREPNMVSRPADRPTPPTYLPIHPPTSQPTKPTQTNQPTNQPTN